MSATKEEILLTLSSTVDNWIPKNRINPVRRNVLDSGTRAFGMNTFDPRASLSVRFPGEDGIDDGGLSREFMRLARKAIPALPIFRGTKVVVAKKLTLDLPAFENKTYKTAGSMLAYMLVHHGPVPNFMDPFLYDALSNGLTNLRAEISNVSDYDLRDHIQKIASSTKDTFFENVEPLECLIRVSGCAAYMAKPERKAELVDALCQYLVVENMKGAYDQFAQGLATLGVLEAIKAHSDVLRSLFVFEPRPLTSYDIYELYKAPTFSPMGSNQHLKEEETMSWWRDFVLQMEASDELPVLLGFLTGLDEIPPLGFDNEATIEFRHHEALDLHDATREYPIVNTCGLVLRLPILPSYDIFEQRFNAAMGIKNFTAY